MMNNFESCDSEKKNQLENLVILPFRYQLLLFENENFPYQTALVGIFCRQIFEYLLCSVHKFKLLS